MKLVIAEKPSVAQSIARVIGAAGRKDGYLEGNGYLVSWCVGHLVELSAPETYDERYSKWRLEDLPILPDSWLYHVSPGTKKQFGILKELMKRPDVEYLIELPIGIEKNWKHQLSDLPRVGESGMVEYPQVNTFIDTALRLATETGDFAIINYAIKKLKGLNLSENGQKLAAKRFMHMAVLYPYLLHLMEEFVFSTYSVKTCDIQAFSTGSSVYDGC